MAKKKNKISVLSKYKPAYDQIVRKMMSNGATGYEVSQTLGITQTTFYHWVNKHESFGSAYRLGGVAADKRVEVSLYEKAVGYKWQEEVKTKEYDETGKEIEKVTTIEKSAPPDNSAIFFFLKNRRGDKWKDKHEMVVHHNVTITNDSDLYRLANEHIDAIEADYAEITAPTPAIPKQE